MKRINLLPKDLQPKWKSGIFRNAGKRFNPVILGVPVVLAVVCLFFWQQWVYARYHNEAKAFKKELSRIQRQSSEFKEKEQDIAKRKTEMLDEIRKLEIREQVLENMRQSVVHVSDILARFVEVIPEDIWITELELTDKGLKVAGTAHDAKSVAQLMDKLNNSKYFRKTQFNYTERAVKPDSQGFSFEISTVPIWGKGAK